MSGPTTTRKRAASVTRTRFLIVAISALTGVCFAVLAGLSISAMAAPFRRFHYFSVVIAAASILVGYWAFRAATSGHTDRVTVANAMFRGMIGALVSLLVMLALLLMFRPDTQSFLAHAVGRPTYTFTIFRLLVAAVLLGFGAGFVARIRTRRR